MNILFICHRIPFPPNKGDKIRSFNELKYLAEKHNISLAFLVDNKNDIRFIDELEKYCKTIDYDVINPKWQKVKSLPYLLSKKPLTVPYFYSKKLQNAIDRRLSETDFDVIFVFSSPMAEYVLQSRVKMRKRMRLIMDFVDVDSDKWRMYSEHSIFPKYLLYKREWKCLMNYEKKVGNLFDASIFVSDAEVRLFKSFAPDVHSVAIPNGVDLDYFSALPSGDDTTNSRYNILFTGAMGYFPNEDGVLYFYRKIWPLVKQKVPYAKFYIVGADPSKRLESIVRNDTDIIVTGLVKDIRRYMQIADVFVAPLRIARGVQNKVLEAMASRLPVVATPQVVQGICCNGSGYLYVEDSIDAFAERTIELAGKKLDHDALMKREDYLKERYSWEHNMALLENVITGSSVLS
jgi:sugar transferase (PEP-CTERM/EpsH1 system associated)